MKRISILLLAVLSIMTTYAQKEVAASTAGTIAPTTEEVEKAWKFGGRAGLFANQVALVNWSAGGVSSISGLLNGDIFANYRKGKHSWENNFKAEYGLIKEKSADLKKNADRMELNSKYGYQIDKKGTLFVGALMSFNTQFTMGYTAGEVRHSSNFLSPGNLVLAAGLDWKPSDMFSLFFSPVAGKLVFVTDKGVDETTYGLNAGAQVRTELGAYMKVEFKKDLMKNVKFKTALTLYTNYLDTTTTAVYENDVFFKRKSNFGNIDVDWSVGIDLTVNKWITVNLGTQLIYDHNTKINLFDKEGNTIMSSDGSQKTGARTQFKEALNVGVNYRFKPKEKKEVKK